MIRLDSRNLPANVARVLQDLQDRIDAEPDFESRVSLAQKLWASKGGSAGKAAFEEVKKELLQLCVYIGVCNYCEHNEASDIEHIFPKSFFPGLTFHWNNYLLACKHCNSTFKLDKIHVLDQNDDPVLLPRKVPPISDRVAFLNPRQENPAEVMFLNTLTWQFALHEGLTKAAKQKAEKTLEILELNTRDTLLHARKSAAIHYYERMERLCRIWTAPDIDALSDQLSPFEDKFDLSMPIAQLKSEILAHHQVYISRYQHPSVWKTIKDIHALSPKWKRIFDTLPMALQW